MNNFGRYIPSQYIAPAQPLQIQTGPGWQYIRVINNSPYLLTLAFAGMGTIDFPEFFLEDILMLQNYRGSFTVQSAQNLSNISSGTSNLLSINAYQPGELQHPQSQPLNAPAVTATASGKPIFSATIGFGSTASFYQTLNIFNPPDSGVNFTFHAARCFTNDSTVPATNLLLKTGADLNLGTPVVPVCHTGTGTPPVSFAHCTAEDVVTSHGATSTIEVMEMNQNVTQDFLDFPDTYILTPGNNLYITLTSGSSGHVVRLTMKWSEDIATPAIGGVPTSVATSVINSGNGAGTPVVTGTVAGDNSNALLLTNDGKLTLGDAAHPGSISTDNALIVSDGSGNLAVGGSLKTNTIRDNTSGTDLIDLSSTQVKVNQKLALLGGSITRISQFGNYTATTVLTAFNHNLGDVPDLILLSMTGATSVSRTVVYDDSTLTSTTFKAVGSTTLTFRGLAIKF